MGKGLGETVEHRFEKAMLSSRAVLGCGIQLDCESRYWRSQEAVNDSEGYFHQSQRDLRKSETVMTRRLYGLPLERFNVSG